MVIVSLGLQTASVLTAYMHREGENFQQYDASGVVVQWQGHLVQHFCYRDNF